MPLEDPAEGDSLGPDPSRRLEDRQLLLRLVEWLEVRLTERAWRIFVLKFDEGQPDEAIAETLGVGIQTVYNATFAIRTQARAFLRAAVDPDPSLPDAGARRRRAHRPSAPSPPGASPDGWHVHRTLALP